MVEDEDDTEEGAFPTVMVDVDSCMADARALFPTIMAVPVELPPVVDAGPPTPLGPPPPPTLIVLLLAVVAEDEDTEREWAAGVMTEAATTPMDVPVPDPPDPEAVADDEEDAVDVDEDNVEEVRGCPCSTADPAAPAPPTEFVKGMGVVTVIATVEGEAALTAVFKTIVVVKTRKRR